MPPMSDAEYRDFVTTETRTAKWTTTRRDGRPHVVPVWFVLEGDDLLITTGSKSVKGRAERAQEYGRLNAGEGMLLVRITHEKVVSENNITGE